MHIIRVPGSEWQILASSTASPVTELLIPSGAGAGAATTFTPIRPSFSLCCSAAGAARLGASASCTPFSSIGSGVFFTSLTCPVLTSCTPKVAACTPCQHNRPLGSHMLALYRVPCSCTQAEVWILQCIPLQQVRKDEASGELKRLGAYGAMGVQCRLILRCAPPHEGRQQLWIAQCLPQMPDSAVLSSCM